MTEYKRPFNDILETNLKDVTEQEAEAYKNRVKADNGTLDDVTNIRVTDEGDDKVSVEYEVKGEGPGFERIRRITGNRAKEARQAA